MPVPEGQITTSDIWNAPEVVVPEEPTEVEQKEEEQEPSLGDVFKAFVDYNNSTKDEE